MGQRPLEVEKRMSVKVVVDGNSLKVTGDTYPVKDVLKKHGLHWDKYEKEWYDNTENHSADEIRELAAEVGAELEVHSISELPDFVAKFIPDEVKRTIEELERER